MNSFPQSSLFKEMPTDEGAAASSPQMAMPAEGLEK